MQHCAFVVTAERFREVEARLKSRGIRLEFACQPEDSETPAVISCVTQTKAEVRNELATLPGVTSEMRVAELPG